MEKFQDIQLVFEVLKEDGSNLFDLVLGDVGLKVEEIMKKDFQRYDVVSDQIQRRLQKVFKFKQRLFEVCYVLFQLCGREILFYVLFLFDVQG